MAGHRRLPRERRQDRRAAAAGVQDRRRGEGHDTLLRLPGRVVRSIPHQVELASATLARKEKSWAVRERGGYPANFQGISDLALKLLELKVTQSEQVAETLLPRLQLADPGTGEGAGTKVEGAGTLVEFKDGAGKLLARLTLGKKVLKKDPLNPLPGAKDGVPAGRYVRIADARDTVVVVSDPLNNAEANPGRWLDKLFFKAERIKTLAVGPEGAAPHWKIARAEEWGQWKFAAGGGDLNPSAAVAAVNKLGGLAFDDVVADPKPEDAGRPLVAVAETFDNLIYTVKLARSKTGEDYHLTFSVAGAPPRSRPPEKGEKGEQKERRDKEFAESQQRLEARVALEKVLSQWTYVVSAREAEPLLRGRGDMIARRPPSKK